MFFKKREKLDFCVKTQRRKKREEIFFLDLPDRSGGRNQNFSQLKESNTGQRFF